MSDPERLLKTHAADPEVRQLLEGLRDVRPESGAGLRSWGAMAVKLAALPPIVVLPGNEAVAPSGASAGVSAASGAVSASAGPHGVRAFAVKLLVAAMVPAALGGSAYWVHAADRAGPEAPSASAAAPIVSAANPRPAQVTLSQPPSGVPRGVLAQEREVLAIEVLAANGDTASAKRRAAAFLAAHPTSPYGAKVKRLADAP